MTYKMDDFNEGFHNTATSILGDDKSNEDYFSKSNTMPEKDNRSWENYVKEYGDPNLSNNLDRFNEGYQDDLYPNEPYDNRNGYQGEPYDNRNGYQGEPYGNNYRNDYQNEPYGNNYRNDYPNEPYRNNYRNDYQGEPYDNRNGYQDKPYDNRNGYQDKPYDNRNGYQNEPYDYRNDYPNEPYRNNYRNDYPNEPYDNRNDYQNEPYGNNYRNDYPNEPYRNNYNNQRYENESNYNTYNTYNSENYSYNSPKQPKVSVNLDTKVFKNKKYKKGPLSFLVAPWLILSIIVGCVFLKFNVLVSLIILTQIAFGFFLLSINSVRYDINNFKFCVGSLSVTGMFSLLTCWFAFNADGDVEKLREFIIANIAQSIIFVFAIVLVLYGFLIGFLKAARCKYETQGTVLYSTTSSISSESVNFSNPNNNKFSPYSSSGSDYSISLSSPFKRPVLEYEVNDECYKRTYDCFGTLSSKKFEVNSVHTLYVNEDNPEELYMPDAENNYFYAIIGIILFIVGVSLYMIL